MLSEVFTDVFNTFMSCVAYRHKSTKYAFYRRFVFKKNKSELRLDGSINFVEFTTFLMVKSC